MGQRYSSANFIGTAETIALGAQLVLNLWNVVRINSALILSQRDLRVHRFRGPRYHQIAGPRENQEGKTAQRWNIRESERSATMVTITLFACILKDQNQNQKKKLWVQGLLSYFGPGPTKGSDSRSMAMSHSVGKIFSFKG